MRWAVAIGVSKIDSPVRQKERRDRFLVREEYYKQSLALSPQQKPPKIADLTGGVTRESLEEEARQASLTSSRVEDRFWARQRNWSETANIGSVLIERATSVESKKSQ
jgi:hypothetical protein